MKTTHLILMSSLCITQAIAFNLPKQETKSYECERCSQLSHDTLNKTWKISNIPLSTEVSNRQRSVSFKKQVTMEQLRAGVSLSIDAPGAVVRITPLQKQHLPHIQVITPANKQLGLKDASFLYKEDATFDDAFSAAPNQTLLQLKPELGSGLFKIQSDDKNASGAFLINVFDKFSDSGLEIETDSIHYQYGDTITTKISLHNKGKAYKVRDITAYLVNPKKETIQLKLHEVSRNVFESSTTLLSETNDNGENWYVKADISAEFTGSLVQRSGHAAFSYSIPSASLLTVKQTSSNPLTFETDIDVATASRYALQTVLFRKNAQGEEIPIETTQKAQWLEPGKQQIQFTFDNSSQLKDDNLYLGYLRLIDYGQLKTVYQFNQPIKLTQLGANE